MPFNADESLEQYYTEAEAATALGISVYTVRRLLDEHVFTDGSERPAEILLRASDLVLLRFWQRSEPQPKVIRMPKQV